MIFALTNASLDITLGVTWWTIKQLFGAGAYLYSLATVSPNAPSLVLGEIIPYKYPLIELEVETRTKSAEPIDDFHEFTNITAEKAKYFAIPLKDLIVPKLPLWIITFLNAYPLTNYTTVLLENKVFDVMLSKKPIFSPYTLKEHLLINPASIKPEFVVYFKKNDVDNNVEQLNAFFAKSAD